MKILRIQAADTYNLRKLLLSDTTQTHLIKFDNDEDEDLSFHLGAFYESKLVSVASFYYQRNILFVDQHQYQLRGMATHPDFQHKGFSRELLNMAFPIIEQNFCSLLWCMAKIEAQGFYEKVGFLPFDKNQISIEGIGLHTLMSKTLR